jgi:hypothetical protein
VEDDSLAWFKTNVMQKFRALWAPSSEGLSIASAGKRILAQPRSALRHFNIDRRDGETAQCVSLRSTYAPYGPFAALRVEPRDMIST